MTEVTPINLTPVQFEIMQVVWSASHGATVAEIWGSISTNRDVARTTILNLVDRLQKRGWLSRQKVNGVYRYMPTMARDKATAQFAGEFVDAFFGGSASELMMSLIGSHRISQEEVEELREFLKQRMQENKKSQGPEK